MRIHNSNIRAFAEDFERANRKQGSATRNSSVYGPGGRVIGAWAAIY
jgi:hypothetical protein